MRPPAHTLHRARIDGRYKALMTDIKGDLRLYVLIARLASVWMNYSGTSVKKKGLAAEAKCLVFISLVFNLWH